MSTDVVLVLVTAPSMEKAAELGRTLVEEKLAACANLVPGVRSIYQWQGAIQDEGEVLMLLKSTAERFASLRERILELHPYEVPEVVRLAVEDGHAPYLAWVRASVASST